MNKILDLAVRLFVILIVFLCFVVVAYCQENKPIGNPPHYVQHSGQEKEKWEDELRVRVAMFTSKDDNLIYLRKENKYGIKLFSFGYDPESKVPKLKPEKCYLWLYCLRHLYVVSAIEIDCKYN